MDDAGGGRRGARPSLSDELIDAVARAFDVSVDAARDLGGSANLNALLTTSSGSLVLRAYRPYVGPDRVEAIQRARAAIADAGIPTASLVAARNGVPFVVIGPSVIELEEHVPCDEKMDSASRVQRALPFLGVVHDGLAVAALGESARAAEFANYVAPEDVVARVRVGTDRIRAWGPNSEEAALADAADRLAVAVDEAHQSLASGLPPPQFAHGDYWDDNVLFRDGRLALVADLDFLNERLRIDDLALTLFFTSYILGPSSSVEMATALAPLVDAYDAGTTRPLSETERAALPIAIARQPLWSIAVWAALLDDEAEARRHVDGHLEAVQRGLDTLAHLAAWQDSFA